MGPRYYRIALCAYPDRGIASVSSRIFSALEAQGHTVFCFSPRTFPELFEGKQVSLSKLERFLDVQNVDLLLLADGLGCTNLAPVSNGAAVAIGLICGSACEAQESAMLSAGASYDFGWTLCSDEACTTAMQGVCTHVYTVSSCADSGYVNGSLANDIAFEPGIVCLQDATTERMALMESLLQKLPGYARAYCFGQGWPQEWTCNDGFNGFVYASCASSAVVLFCDSESAVAWGKGYACDTSLALAHANGNKLVGIGGQLEASCWRNTIAVASDAQEATRLIESAAGRNEGDKTADDAEGETAAEPMLDEALADALNSTNAALPSNRRLRGTEQPRRIVCVMGYYGMGNFGDEYILATLDRRIRAAFPGASVVAISENAYHTLTMRGIFAIRLADKLVVDEALSHSSVALITAGLLFDQGIRWTMGKAELASSTLHSDIAGMTSYCLLANMNDATPICYGIGAGPLELPDGHALVGLMGTVGTLFLTRDTQTGDLIRSCGVAPSQVKDEADSAFLGTAAGTDFVDEWIACHCEKTGSGKTGEENSRKIFAVSLRNYENLPDDFALRISHTLDKLADAYEDMAFALCALDPDDCSLLKQVHDAMRHREQAHLFDAQGNVEAQADLLSRSYAGLSMRYHCSLLLNRFGHPCVGIDYLPKVASLYKDTGCSQLLLGPCADESDLSKTLFVMLDNYDEWRKTITSHVDVLTKRSLNAESALIEAINSKAPDYPREGAQTYFLYDRCARDRELNASFEQEAASRRTIEELQGSISRLQDEVQCARQEAQAVRDSNAFKVGVKLMRIPRALKDALGALHIRQRLTRNATE